MKHETYFENQFFNPKDTEKKKECKVISLKKRIKEKSREDT